MSENEVVNNLFNALLKLAKENIDENRLKEKVREEMTSTFKKYMEMRLTRMSGHDH